jgi:hypothetical protein
MPPFSSFLLPCLLSPSSHNQHVKDNMPLLSRFPHPQHIPPTSEDIPAFVPALGRLPSINIYRPNALELLISTFSISTTYHYFVNSHQESVSLTFTHVTYPRLHASGTKFPNARGCLGCEVHQVSAGTLSRDPQSSARIILARRQDDG